MLFKQKTEEEFTTSKEVNNGNIIGKGTLIQGNLKAGGNIRVEGVIEGEVETKSKLVVSETGKIKGNILANSLEIAGTVEGTLKVQELITLRSTSIIQGDIHTKKIIIEVGAQFNGKCTTNPNKEKKLKLENETVELNKEASKKPTQNKSTS